MDENRWTCDEVGAWLRDIGYEKYVKFFADNRMDGQALSLLTTDELFGLVKCFNDTFKLGDVLKFRSYLAPFQKRKKPPGIGSAPTGSIWPLPQFYVSPNHQMADQPNNQMADQTNHKTTDQSIHQMADQPNHQMADQTNNQMADQLNHQMADQPNQQVIDQPLIDESDQINVSFNEEFATGATMGQIEQNDNWRTYNESGDVVIWGDGDDAGSTPNSPDEINRSAELMVPISVEIPATEKPSAINDQNMASGNALPKIGSIANSASENPNIPMGGQSSKAPNEESPTVSAIQTTAAMGDGPKIKNEQFQFPTPISPTQPSKPIQTTAAAFGGSINVSGTTISAKPPVRVSVAASYNPDLKRHGLNFGNPLFARLAQAKTTASATPQDALPSPLSASDSLPSPQAGMTSPQIQSSIPKVSTSPIPQVVPTPSPPVDPMPTLQSPLTPLASSSKSIPARDPLPSAHLSKASHIYRYLISASSLPKAGKLFRAYVSFTESPLEFSILEEKSHAHVMKMGDNLNRFYEQDPYILPLPQEMIKAGTACAAKFEGSWYRALITKVLADDKVQVRYVDYGNKETLPRRALMALKKDRMTDVPMQCIDVRLDGIPTDQQISDDQRDDFYDMVEPLKKAFLVKIDSYATGPPYVAQVTDTVFNRQLNVAAQHMLGIPTGSSTDVEPLKENNDAGGCANELDEAFWNQGGAPYGDDEDDY